jgi:hypothetical protein
MGVDFFSQSYYKYPLLFLDKLPSVIPPAGYVGEYATVSHAGTLCSTLRPQSFFGRFKAFFTFRQNADLPQVDARLCQIFEMLKKPESAEFQAFKNEVRRNGRQGFTCLKANIVWLYAIMTVNNAKSIFQRTALRIVNIVRGLFGKEKIAFAHYNFADLNQPQMTQTLQAIKKEAFKLSEDEAKQAAFCFEIRDSSGLASEDKLTAKRIFKMQTSLGASEKVFTVWNNVFFLFYSPKEKTFSLQYDGLSEPNIRPFSQSVEKILKTDAVDVTFVLPKNNVTYRLVAQIEKLFGNGWFKSGYQYKPTPSPRYSLPYNTEVQIKIDGKKEPFSFVIRQVII